MKQAITKLLLVDDEPALLEGLKMALRREPYAVYCADSGEAALELLAQHRFSAVVSDERMSGISGSELLTQVRQRYPATARILLTGQASLCAAVRCINDAQVARFLEKPCPARTLAEAIAQAITAQTGGAPVAAAGPRPVGGFTPTQLQQLSPREREVFDLVVSGCRLSQVARRLFVSPHTARNHLKSIFAKLSVHSQVELLERAGR